MATIDASPERRAQAPWIAVLLLVCGVAILTVSFIWPSDAASRSNWSQENAKAYQAASIKLHSLSHESAHSVGKPDEDSVRKEFEQAKTEYTDIRRQLDNTIEGPKHTRI